jgi:hypothetical protein
MTDPLSAAMGAVLPLSAVRALQRRLGLLVGAAELPRRAADALRAVAAAADVQLRASAAVDGALDAPGSAAPLVAARAAEARALLARVASAAEAQATRLRDGALRACN